MSNEMHEDVKQYMARFKDCSAEDILAYLGELRDFFHEAMSEEEMKKYEKIKASILERKTR